MLWKIHEYVRSRDFSTPSTSGNGAAIFMLVA